MPGFDIARAYEELPAHDPERMKGQSKPCWTPFPISTIIRFEDGCRTMDVGSWLRSLGLGQYEAAFRDNTIDADVLPQLTDGDLAQLGVTLGDRKRLLEAIAVWVAHGARRDADETSAPILVYGWLPSDVPITVMFCDLVGSTSLAAKLDAEDWRNLVNAYLDEASAAVTGFGGHVLKKLGDGLMALFGYPQAQENDAERAVRAALAIQRALAELNTRNAAKGAPELSARIGIESGPVVVEASGEVFGDAPNIAARVQSAAEPGSVLITATSSGRRPDFSSPRTAGRTNSRGVGADDALSRRSRERRRPARRGARSNPARGARGGTGTA